MDKITEHSPKRLIVVDAVDALAQELFGDKYDYDMTTTLYDPLEVFEQQDKPKWVTILGDEASELHDLGGTIVNTVLINGQIFAKVPSNNLAHAMPYLQDIDVLKKELIGQMIEYKGHVIYGNVQSEEHPAWSTFHDIDLTGKILRIQFAILLRIHD